MFHQSKILNGKINYYVERPVQRYLRASRAISLLKLSLLACVSRVTGTMS